jgi:hypothetical protein
LKAFKKALSRFVVEDDMRGTVTAPAPTFHRLGVKAWSLKKGKGNSNTKGKSKGTGTKKGSSVAARQKSSGSRDSNNGNSTNRVNRKM